MRRPSVRPLPFNDNQLAIDGHEHRLEHPILCALDLGSRIVVLFDPRASSRGQFANLITLHRDAEQLWRADLPTTYVGDHYIDVCFDRALHAASAKSYRCLIDLDSGKILQRVFCPAKRLAASDR